MNSLSVQVAIDEPPNVVSALSADFSLANTLTVLLNVDCPSSKSGDCTRDRLTESSDCRNDRYALQLGIFAAAASAALSDDVSRLCCDHVLGRSDETSTPACAIFGVAAAAHRPRRGATAQCAGDDCDEQARARRTCERGSSWGGSVRVGAATTTHRARATMGPCRADPVSSSCSRSRAVHRPRGDRGERPRRGARGVRPAVSR